MKVYKNNFPNGKLQEHLLSNRPLIKSYLEKKFFEEEFNSFKYFKEYMCVLRDIMKENKKVIILTDYDSDGVHSCIILKKALDGLGIENDFYIEPRTSGYGLRKETIKKYNDLGYSALITADFGIKNHIEIQFAKDLGMAVILTDHHTVGETLPNADVIVNPVMEDDSCRFGKLCGAGVAYKLMKDTYADMCLEFDTNLELLHFATIGTIGDLVSLKSEYNYLLVREGLKTLHQTNNKPLDTLLRFSMGRFIPEVKSTNVSYGIVPIVNSVSRLEHSFEFVKFYLEEDRTKIFEFAKHVLALNNKRKDIQRAAQRTALAKVYEDGLDSDEIIVLKLNTVKGVCGLVASYISDIFGRPTLVCTEYNGQLVGSARSVGAFSIYDAMNSISHVFDKWGGHPMAAGFSLKTNECDTLRKEINAYVKDNPIEDYYKEVECSLKINLVGEPLMEILESVEPSGMCNEKPLFRFDNLVLETIEIINGHSFMTLKDLTNTNMWEGRNSIKGIMFFRELTDIECGDVLDIVCTVQDKETLLFDNYKKVEE